MKRGMDKKREHNKPRVEERQGSRGNCETLICGTHFGDDATRQTTDQSSLCLSHSLITIHHERRTWLLIDILVETRFVCLCAAGLIYCTNDLAGSSQMMEITGAVTKVKVLQKKCSVLFFSLPRFLHSPHSTSSPHCDIFKINFYSPAPNSSAFHLSVSISSPAFSPTSPSSFLSTLTSPLISHSPHLSGAITPCLRTEISIVCLSPPPQLLLKYLQGNSTAIYLVKTG